MRNIHHSSFLKGDWTVPSLTANLSMDLDNLWSYMKTHGDSGWEDHPTYFPVLIPLVLDWLERHGQKITFFVVGQDALMPYNCEALHQIAAAGHEFGNHSFSHEQWMHNRGEQSIIDELRRTEDCIGAISGRRPVGFRGPGFCTGPAMIHALQQQGYTYDASLLPSLLGPLARLYYLWGTRLNKEDSRKRSDLFGPMRNGFLPIQPFLWNGDKAPLLELPVTTIPMLRVPFHLSYILWLSGFSKSLALRYMKFAFFMCRQRRVEPSFLLHPLDFLGREDAPELAFFPGMNLPREDKLEMADLFLEEYRKSFEVVMQSEHVRRLRARNDLKTIDPETAMPRADLDTASLNTTE